MIVRDDELHAVQPARLQPFDEGRPARARLPIRELDAQDLAPSLAVDPDRDEDRLRCRATGRAALIRLTVLAENVPVAPVVRFETPPLAPGTCMMPSG